MRPLVSVLGMGVLLLSAAAGNAAVYTWTGQGSSGNWSDEDNWTGAAGYPDGSGDTVSITTKNGDYWPSLDGDYTVGSITGGDAGGTDGRAYTLTVDVFTIISGSTEFTISGSGAAGVVISADRIVINGSGKMTVSGTGSVQTR